MTDLTRLMSIGQGAMSANQRRMANAQNNIANASTDGYVRQRVDAMTIGGKYATNMRGVTTSGPHAMRANFLDKQEAALSSQLGSTRELARSAATLEGLLYPNAESGPATRIGAFFDSLGTLSSQPSSPAYRRDALQRAEDVAAAFRRDAGVLTNELSSLEGALRGSVDTLNQDLKDIARLDTAIRESIASGSPANEIIDERNRVIGKVTQATGMNLVHANDGTVQLLSQDGRAFVEGGVAREVGLSKNNGVLELTLASTAGPQTVGSPGGAIGGRLEAHNNVALGALNDLNQMAEEFAKNVNAQHQLGFGLDGQTNRALFDVGATNQAASLKVSDQLAGKPERLGMSATGQPGDNTVLRDIMNLRDAPTSTGISFEATLRGMHQELGQTINRAEREYGLADSSLFQLENMRQSIEGVSLEEEIVALSEAQRGFEAALKVMNASQSMFDSLMSMKG